MLLAVGDFGRQTLFPFSDVELLFLFETQEAEDRCAEPIRRLSEQMGQVGLKTKVSAKTLSELLPFDSENAEAILSLLDSRFLAGDAELFSNLRDHLIPEVMVREAQVLVERLAEMTRNRHRKFANTVFHLVPNVKDGPGGYLDYIVARRLAVLSAMEKQHGWPDSDACFSPAVQADDGFGAGVFCVRALLSAIPAKTG